MQKLRICPGGVLDGSSLVVARGDKADPYKSGGLNSFHSRISLLWRLLLLEARSCPMALPASKLERLGIPKTKEKNGKYQVPGQENFDQQEGY